MKHLTGIAALSDSDIEQILTGSLAIDSALAAKQSVGDPLKDQLLVNLFYENSTRTSLSFATAGMRMGAHVITVPVAASSVHKGESVRDTVLTLCAQGADFMVLRASGTGTIEAARLAIEEHGFTTSIINAGEGAFGHPTQALLDAATILKALGRSANDRLDGLKIAIIGDLVHSRVAASCAPLFSRLGAEVRYCGPPDMLPNQAPSGVATITHDSREALEDADIVMALRIQLERVSAYTAVDIVSYRAAYGLSKDTLSYAKPEALVMHPGPMNRGVEIDNEIADDPARSLILKQVAMGVPTRMAVLEFTAAP
ncbi:MAG: aspartate carbamoyltransferase catalytic subunit [Pseudomonadota bacterium]